MDKNITLAEIENNLQRLNKLYDAIRLIDPINQRVVERDDHIPIDRDCIYWHNELLGDNSIAICAYKDNKYYVKTEQFTNSLLLITALPIDGTLVLEMLKNVSDAILIENNDYQYVKHLAHDFISIALRDEMTGLYNRRYVYERLKKDISNAIAKQHPLSIIFLDIDNFKKINDSYGHAFGDKVLIDVSNILIKSTRFKTDWVARYGGDEFLFCLNDTEEGKAFEIAERIRIKIAELAIL